MRQDASVTIVCEVVEVVEQQLELSLEEFCRAGGVSPSLVVELAEHGLLEPLGERDPGTWRLGSAGLGLARRAQRLIDDLGVNAAGAAVALELLDRIERLERERP